MGTTTHPEYLYVGAWKKSTFMLELLDKIMKGHIKTVGGGGTGKKKKLITEPKKIVFHKKRKVKAALKMQ